MKLLKSQTPTIGAAIPCSLCGTVKLRETRNWELEDPGTTDGYEISDELLKECEQFQSALHFPSEEEVAEEAEIVKEYFEELAKNGG